MSAILPIIFLNLFLYYMFSRKLQNRKTNSTRTRDSTLSKTVLILSASWMVLWLPIIVFRIVYGFLEIPNLGNLFLFKATSYDSHKKYYLTEFMLLQISLLFSSVNSVILIVLLRPFHNPLLKLRRKFAGFVSRRIASH